jgi:hypothetical protein
MHLAKLDPDPLHDGAQYAPALGSALGKIVGKDLFEQYGPANVWLHAFVLDVFGFQVLNLRYLSVFLILTTAIMMFYVMRTFTSNINLSFLPSFIWLLTCPVFSIYPGSFGLWTWPSLISTIIILASYLLLNFLKSDSKHHNYAIGLLAFLSLFLMLTRLQIGVLLFFSICVYLSFASIKEQKFLYRKFLYGFLSSFLLLLALFSTYLFLTNSTLEFLQQVILGPANNYVTKFNLQSFYLYYILGSLPVFLSSLLFFKFKHKVFVKFFLVTTLLVIIIVIFIQKQNAYSSLQNSSTFRAITDVLGVIFLYASFSLSLATVAYLIVANRFPKFSTVFSSDHRMILFLFLLPAAFVQIYPVDDIYHLWWLSPITILFATAFLIGSNLLETLKWPFLVWLITTFIFVSSSLQTTLQIDRSTMTQGAFKGMSMKSSEIISHNRIYQILSTVESDSSRFICLEPIFSVLPNRFLSVDGKYVSWAWGVNFSGDRSSQIKRTFICSSLEFIEGYASAMKMQIVGEPIAYSFSNFSGGYFAELT